MRQPGTKLLIFILAAMLASFGIAFLIVDIMLNRSIVDYGVGKFSFVALTVLFLFIALAAIFDGPLGLGLFELLERPSVSKPESETKSDQKGGFEFPYEAQAEHWDVDFGDSKKTYEGADLPVWLLAGWAAFVIWAVVYLISGLPNAF